MYAPGATSIAFEKLGWAIGAVVALEVVLDADLPVRLVLALGPLVEDERVDVDPALGDESRQVAEVLGEAAGRRVGIDEDERPPGVDRDGDEAERLPVEAGLAVAARCRAQRPVEVVRPRVVRALQRLAPAGAVAEQVAAMPADVDERAQRVVAAADEDDRDVAGPGRDERPRLGQLPGVPGVLPGAPEDPLLLEAGHRRVDVPVPGDRAAAGVAVAMVGCYPDRCDHSCSAGARQVRRARTAANGPSDDDPALVEPERPARELLESG